MIEISGKGAIDPRTADIEPRHLRITEIFLSLQGESLTQGIPTVFIRLTGCPLRCVYCDTEYAFSGGKRMPIGQIVERTTEHQVSHVTVTGGEPLAQRACAELLTALCNAGLKVSLETSGSIGIGDLDDRVCRVMDLKTPGSGEVKRNLYSNISHLTAEDQVKFVIADETDYQWAKACIDEYDLVRICPVLMLPVFEQQSPSQLADWIIRDRLAVRMQIQLHKALWGDQAGR